MLILVKENFEATLHIMSFALDSSHPSIYDEKFNDNNWMDFYGDVKEAISNNTPTSLGKSVDLRVMVKIDHSG